MAGMADRSPDDVGVRRTWWSKTSRQETAHALEGRAEEVLSLEAAATWQEALDARFVVLATLTRAVARPHAEDILQQTMLELWRYLTSEDPKPVWNVRGWMVKTGTYRMIDYKRELVRKAETLVANHDEIPCGVEAAAGLPESTPDSMRELHDKAREMAKGLHGLVTPWEAEVVVLHKAYRLPAAEVAELLGSEVTVGAVRSATCEALKKLRRQKKQTLHRFGKADMDPEPERQDHSSRTGGGVVRPPAREPSRSPNDSGTG
uniref:RNA polymerase sigma factor n=1 Tax=Streptomyces virginiae TaxID=1961 RepID=UPI002F91285E